MRFIALFNNYVNEEYTEIQYEDYNRLSLFSQVAGHGDNEKRDPLRDRL
jgi:hypothetical protein